MSFFGKKPTPPSKALKRCLDEVPLEIVTSYGQLQLGTQMKATQAARLANKLAGAEGEAAVSKAFEETERKARKIFGDGQFKRDCLQSWNQFHTEVTTRRSTV